MPPHSPAAAARPRKGSLPRWRLCLGVVLVAGGLSAFGISKLMHKKRQEADALLIRQMVASEELILELTPKLGRLSRGMLNLQFPSADAAGEVFAESVTVVDLAPGSGHTEAVPGTGLCVETGFPVEGGSVTVPRGELALWSDLMGQVAWFENTSLRFVRASFTGEGFDVLGSDVKFSALGRMKDGRWSGLSGKLRVTWARQASGDWRITAWETKDLHATTAEQRLFSEALDTAVPDATERFRVRRSIHEEESVKYFQSEKSRAPSYDFSPTAMNQKPAISVGDVDGDGLDDIYIMERLGKNLLLRNRGDGTFEERAEQFELAFPGNSTCGLFADFDNDGDQDLLLGRALERCLYLENTGAWFREVPQEIPLPNLAVSLAAADYNGDGLLDVHVSTYRPGDVGTGLGIESGGSGKPWPERFLSPANAEEFRERFLHSRSGAVPHMGFLDQTGPPNVLLVNKGAGKFAPAPETATLALWKNTLQATWGDYDDDGDPDLYVANDWARDNLFRNDGEKGFTDVTDEAGTNVFGFAMGASWGDYDNDGKQDLYVSNMYSKAGRRIMGQIKGLDSALTISAEGNYLYHQDGAKFKHVSGLEKPALLVADSGWSWGGQFADLDNDADLDIYALSGYFTAPAAVASEVDL